MCDGGSKTERQKQKNRERQNKVRETKSADFSWLFCVAFFNFIFYIYFFFENNNVYIHKKIVKSCVTVVCYSRVLCIVAHPPVSPSTFVQIYISIIFFAFSFPSHYLHDRRTATCDAEDLISCVEYFFSFAKFIFLVVIERETEYINFSITQKKRRLLERVVEK